MKRKLKKYTRNLILISCLVLIATSCTKYKITWRNYSHYDEARIMFTMQNGKKIRVTLNKTRSIYTLIPIEYIIPQQPKGSYLNVYPFFSDNPIESEIFFFDVQYEYKDETKIIVTPRQNVEAYYGDFYSNGLFYTVVSKDNEITVTEPQEIITEPQETKRYTLAEILQTLDAGDFTMVRKGRDDYNMGAYEAGYIVKSNIDNRMIWLQPFPR